jgi:peptide/nickel transport system permease protein
MLTAVVVCVTVLPHIMGTDPLEQDLPNRLRPPLEIAKHPLGTDELGRDVLARLLVGGQISLVVGVVAPLSAAILGTCLGLIAGYELRVGGLIMAVADAQLAFPFILLALVLIATIGPSLGMVVLVLALASWVAFARPVQAMTLSLKHREFVLAASTIGSSGMRILWRELLPHVLPTAIVIATIQVAHIVLFESALSFLGMGVPPEVPTWGAMLSTSRQYLQRDPWLSVLPGLALVVTVFLFTITGDWVRELMDPRRELHV